MRAAGLLVAAAALSLVTAGCTADDAPQAAPRTAPPAPSSTSTGPGAGSTTSADPPPVKPVARVRFRTRTAVATVEHLAGDIGPRETTSDAFAEAASWVAGRLGAYGYAVDRQRLTVPAGNSWGVDVPAGPTVNVIATPPGLRPGDPYRVVGAHLDTVPQAPGGEDNASGVSVLLELARMAAASPPAVPVVFVAFGGEEPRGDGDALHHFGSTAMVDRLTASQRRSLVAMVALDRVGVGTVVPVCSGGLEPAGVRAALLRTASQAGIPAAGCLNQSSDHWSFEKAGLRSARVGGTSYAAYHSAADVAAVVSPAQLGRVGRLMWRWLNA